MSKKNTLVSLFPLFNQRPRAACGVGLVVNIPGVSDHQVVKDGLKALSGFEYRSGFNPVNGESDGAGIRLYGLPVNFYNKKIHDGEFVPATGKTLNDLSLKPKQFILGQYFLAPDQISQAKALIETCVAQSGLSVAAWRNVGFSVNTDVLSNGARGKMPSIWQAILINQFSQEPQSSLFLTEQVALQSSFQIAHHAKKKGLSIDIVSHSSESIVYKGMIKPQFMKDFYLDLSDLDFTASAAALHARFATNTNPKWANAQPCVFFGMHNGEFNSARTNAADMTSEMQARQFMGVYPDKNLSDSMQFDADLANQMVMKNITLTEAIIRLMPSRPTQHMPEDQKAMLQVFARERIPYNGPAFLVAGSGDHYLAALDQMGLRPSRWALIESKNGKRQFHAASDDYLSHTSDYTVLKKGQLEPGGIIMVTPQGELLKTADVLTLVHKSYAQQNTRWFQHRLEAMRGPIRHVQVIATPKASASASIADLNRRLHSAGWDYETEEHGVRYMATHGSERLGAMGDDTNPLHTAAMPMHVSYFFHQLFAQVSAPPLDSIKEQDRFSLAITLGPAVKGIENPKLFELPSPVLNPQAFSEVESNDWIGSEVLDLSFPIPENCSLTHFTQLLHQAIKRITIEAEQLVLQTICGVIILSDRTGAVDRACIPDVIAVAAVRKHLEFSRLVRSVSLVVDSYQIAGPHQAALLLAVGAKAVYPRGAYEKIEQLFAAESQQYMLTYQSAINKCLLKTMGKMGISDVNNYINGHLVAALGLDLTPDPKAPLGELSLASMFQGIYSPLKGYNLSHVAANVFLRHQQSYDKQQDFYLLPRSGFYMPEHQGIKHGFGPEVVNAFTAWLKDEELRAKRWQMHTILERLGYPGFISDVSQFSPEQGFLDPRKKDNSSTPGIYPTAYLETIRPSAAFRSMLQAIDIFRQQHPTSLRDYFNIKTKSSEHCDPLVDLETQASIRSRLFSGSMSQGALTVTNPDKPSIIGAHETLTRGMNAIGAMSASGEGGEAPQDMRSSLLSTRSKQIASGRFGVSARQIIEAVEIEIKVAQGAKPGEGGELPAEKVSVRFASQRGGLPGLNFISPPPHHDIYSIEDLEQLIYDIKSVSRHAKVTVKLVASEGIDTIAVGVAKAGADVINIAGNSGGTAAAQQSSIKHTGLPAELALVEINRALTETGLRDLVQLRVSGGFKTVDDVIMSAIFGADLFEFGTTAMLTLGCKMQRTCNHSCQPGVATDGHLFKGDQLNTERYFVNLAAAIQERLHDLGVSNLGQLRGRIDLLEQSNAQIDSCFDLSMLLHKPKRPVSVTDDAILNAQKTRIASGLIRDTEDQLIGVIQSAFTANASETVHPPRTQLNTSHRSFGARIAGLFVKHLEAHPEAKVMLTTQGQAGQSLGFVLPHGVTIHHTGTVQDGCGKSMTGGELVLKTPDECEKYRGDCNTIAGNALAYGASGGKLFVNGVAGHRCGVLLKGAEIVVEGVGDLAFEYMTSGTGLILGTAGPGLCNSAMGGIVFLYDPHNTNPSSSAVRVAPSMEQQHYESAIVSLLEEHAAKTSSIKAKEILAQFNINQFKVLIPKQLDLITTPRQLIDVMKTYTLNQAPLTRGMHVWLQQKIEAVFQPEVLSQLQMEDRFDLRSCLKSKFIAALFPEALRAFLYKRPGPVAIAVKHNSIPLNPVSLKQERMVEERLSTIAGGLDEVLVDALQHIDLYVSALSHDAQGCSGCRAQSCAGGDAVDSGCPAGKSINTINALLKRLQPLQLGVELTQEQWRALRQAFEVQIQASPFIAYTGAACPAPCQDACTESIPNAGEANPARAGKSIGESVHIKNIEYYLFQIGRRFGWFDGKKTDASDTFAHYDAAMQGFKPAFRQVRSPQLNDKELIIIGSGPAAMQLAFEALRDGVKVRMYEKSAKPGGLLADGIPAQKFSKIYIEEDFSRLISMGLELHLNGEVIFDAHRREYTVKNSPEKKIIANLYNERQVVALCVGSGSPKTLPAAVTAGLDPKHRQSIIQAIDFLQAANTIAPIVNNPSMTPFDREQLIAQHFQHMDPRGKKIVVVGGGDTAQDVIRWVARYFNDHSNHRDKSELNVLVRGIDTDQRGILDGYPAASRAPTKENKLRDEEVLYVEGKTTLLVQTSRITAQHNDQLTLDISQSEFKYHTPIGKNPILKHLAASLPREMRPLDPDKVTHKRIEDVDLVICAMGFTDPAGIPIIADSLSVGSSNLMIAGDASGVESSIIIGAQANAKNTYQQAKSLLLGTNKSSHASGMHSWFGRNASNLEIRAMQEEPGNRGSVI
jgi:glutamate synthase (NADPH) large chain